MSADDARDSAGSIDSLRCAAQGVHSHVIDSYRCALKQVDLAESSSSCCVECLLLALHIHRESCECSSQLVQ